MQYCCAALATWTGRQLASSLRGPSPALAAALRSRYYKTQWTAGDSQIGFGQDLANIESISRDNLTLCPSFLQRSVLLTLRLSTMVYENTVIIATGESEERSEQIELPLLERKDLDLLTVLGSGGFGRVHYGVYGGVLEVAVKQSHQQHKNQDRFSDSFYAEIRAATLQHENIVRVLGLCVDQELSDDALLPMLVMEYAGDRNLQSLVNDRSECIDTSRRLKFAKDMTSGLNYAHNRGFLHLDVKLLNVIVSSDDRCKLADFGCSLNKAAGKADTPTKSMMTGTYAYRAPELLRGKVATDRSDIYSLSICLWQLLTRKRPYADDEHQVIVFGVVSYNLRPELPEQFDNTVDERYCELFKQAWNVDPTARPSAKQLLSTLTELESEVND